MAQYGEDREWEVPVRVTFQGTAFVRASTAGAALDLIAAGTWDSDDIHTCAEMVNWESRGQPKELT